MGHTLMAAGVMELMELSSGSEFVGASGLRPVMMHFPDRAETMMQRRDT